MLKAGFAEIDITPPVGTEKGGWLIKIASSRILDPLYARVAVLDNGTERLGFIQLDLLSVRWSTVHAIRRRIEAACGFPAANIMVGATHNHAGPAASNLGDARRDEVYLDMLVEKCVTAFCLAWSARQPAEIGFNRVFEAEVAFNRRVIMRNGTVCCQRFFADDPNCLCLEGPVDPEVAVLALRRPQGELLGCLFNFACHPTHHGDGGVISAGFPGRVCHLLKKHGCPVTLYLNGAGGNVLTNNYLTGRCLSMEEASDRLSAAAQRALAGMEYKRAAGLRAVTRVIQLPYRQPSAEDVAGTARGAERFSDSAVYERGMPALLERIKARGSQPAEVQVLALNDVALAGIPAEYFVEFGLRIKAETWPWKSLVVGQANGMVGYVPTPAAFKRGGYETTLAGSSRLAPEAGDLLADTAISLINSLQPEGKGTWHGV